MFRQLVARNYLSVDIDGYGALYLLERSWTLLRGEENIDLRRDSKIKIARQKRKAVVSIANDLDPVLWQTLRSLRLELAREQGVPAYIRFP